MADPKKITEAIESCDQLAKKMNALYPQAFVKFIGVGEPGEETYLFSMETAYSIGRVSFGQSNKTEIPVLLEKAESELEGMVCKMQGLSEPPRLLEDYFVNQYFFDSPSAKSYLRRQADDKYQRQDPNWSKYTRDEFDRAQRLKRNDALMAPEGWKLASRHTQDLVSGAMYEKSFGGLGKPKWDMTIAQQDNKWVPVHGITVMDPVESPERAAEVLAGYYRAVTANPLPEIKAKLEGAANPIQSESIKRHNSPGKH